MRKSLALGRKDQVVPAGQEPSNPRHLMRVDLKTDHQPPRHDSIVVTRINAVFN
jgi:hypothetical protein